MAWHHVDDETIHVPQYEVQLVAVSHGVFGGLKERSTKEPTGEVVEVTHSIWRCGNCRALAVCKQGERPAGACGKCGARG